jgi:hypothetical protein
MTMCEGVQIYFVHISFLLYILQSQNCMEVCDKQKATATLLLENEPLYSMNNRSPGPQNRFKHSNENNKKFWNLTNPYDACFSLNHKIYTQTSRRYN